MTADSTPPGRRKEPRYQITGEGVLRTSILRPDTQPLLVDLMDLSRNGLRMATHCAIPKNEQVEIEICVSKSDVVIRVPGTVRWVTPGVNQSWFVGCTLNEKITEKQISQLAAASALERRENPRRPISVDAEAKSELGSAYHPVRLVNYSEGGCCISSQNSIAKPGERLMVKIPRKPGANPRTIRAKAAWCTQLVGGYSTGCRFLAREDYLQLLACLPAEGHQPSPVGSAPKRRFDWRIVAAAISVIFTFQVVRIVTSERTKNGPAPGPQVHQSAESVIRTSERVAN